MNTQQPAPDGTQTLTSFFVEVKVELKQAERQTSSSQAVEFPLGQRAVTQKN